jgi:hypothetical protein
VFDGIRGLDLLCSLDFVDASRLAVVGHSMGAGHAIRTQVFDHRVKAGILSGCPGPLVRYFPLVCPRLLMVLHGRLDDTCGAAAEIIADMGRAAEFYGSQGVPGNFLLRAPRHQHYFLDEFKWEAYARLKEHFGMLPSKQSLQLAAILKKCLRQKDNPYVIGIDELSVSADTTVYADRNALVNAFQTAITALAGKGASPRIEASTAQQDSSPSVTICAVGVSQEAKGWADHLFRRAQQLFVENSARSSVVASERGLQWIVTFDREPANKRDVRDGP